MKTYLLLLLLALCSYDACAKYSPLRLAELIDDADLIVDGKIISVQENSVTVNVLHFIQGPHSAAILHVNKYEDWTCAARFAPYQVGQQEIFFLKKSKLAGKYHVLGAGNEGEMPVVKNKVYYKQQYFSIDEHPQQFTVYGGTVSGYVYDRNDLEAAIRFYTMNRSVMQNAVTPKQLQANAAKNLALARISDELQPQRCCPSPK